MRLTQLEYRNGLHQLIGLVFQRTGCGGHLFNQRRVLLCDLIQLGYRFPDLRHAMGLVFAGHIDLANDVSHILY